jgi:dTDP-4-amino-4,6-dideoxygalactose transaminase
LTSTKTGAPRGPRTPEELAIFSGQVAFTRPLHVGRPNIGDRSALLDRINGALDRRWLTNDGELVQEFEAKVAEITGARACVAVVNATVGLELVARALGLSGEVILPGWTFIGTAHALSWVGLTPVFADVDPATHNLDADAVDRAVTPLTTAILGVHLWGRPCDADRLADTAARHGLPLIFDAAHAFGCSYQSGPVGGLGTASVFSFHATKVVSAGEGGAITTNDASLATRLRRMRNFGFYDYDAVTELGTNAKMNELSAAMGLTSLESLDGFIDINRRNYAAYERALGGIPGIQLLSYADGDRHNYHYIVLELTESGNAISRDDLVAVLHAENVLARRYFYPGCHRMEPYRQARVTLLHTEALSERVVVLPTGTSISTEEIETICSIIRVAIKNSEAVTERLRATRATARG